jgi:hypothetical protein
LAAAWGSEAHRARQTLAAPVRVLNYLYKEISL